MEKERMLASSESCILFFVCGGLAKVVGGLSVHTDKMAELTCSLGIESEAGDLMIDGNNLNALWNLARMKLNLMRSRWDRGGVYNKRRLREPLGRLEGLLINT